MWWILVLKGLKGKAKRGGGLVSVEGFLDDGKGAARLLLRCFQPFRLEVFLKERGDFVVQLCAEGAEWGRVAIGELRLLLFLLLRGRLCHIVPPINEALEMMDASPRLTLARTSLWNSGSFQPPERDANRRWHRWFLSQRGEIRGGAWHTRSPLGWCQRWNTSSSTDQLRRVDFLDTIYSD